MCPLKFLQDLPIIVKLAIAPVGLLLLMAVLALVVSSTLTRTNVALDHLIGSLEEKSRVLAEAQREATAVQGEMYRIVGLLNNEADAGHLQELALEAQHRILQIEEDLEQLSRTSPLTAEERQANEELISALDAYLVSVRETADALDSGFPIAIMFIVGVEQSYDRVRRKIVAFSELDRTIGQRISSDARARIRSSRQLAILLIAGAFVLGGTLAYLTSRMINRPIAAITSRMSRIARGEGTNLPIPGMDRRDEIGAMAQALDVFKNNAIEIESLLGELQEAKSQLEDLNQSLEERVKRRTAELEAAQDRLLRNERLATLGQLTATVTHELRNPLGALRTALATIRKLERDAPPMMRSSVEIADRSVTRCDNIIGDLLDFTRLRRLRLEITDFDRWLGGVLDEYPLPAGIELRRQLESGVRLSVDHDRIHRTVINLLDNACQAMTEEGGAMADGRQRVLTVAARLARERLELSIGDTGSGVPPEELERVFEPLYSTKSFGVGLGLPIVRQIIEAHGGGVELSSEAGHGTQVVLWLPLHAQDQRAAS